ncbi:transmembrane 56-B-like [Brachionus plicatilis]|uniref:Transmembrane 56-B-like n=1 Tax=Brachionus plicatilis TaxID=10195 RepID=A0A3M7PRZ0_BRAPC|nr:transmembrane 56-B-like [Brachionus plicatilis]RNA01918.1 transmembrane 56-B-like [Brachionus plicatilis]
MDITIQSKSISNLTQIWIFFAAHFCLFQFLHNFLPKYSKLYQSIPLDKQASTLIRILSSFHAIIATVLSLCLVSFDHDLHNNKLIYTSFAISFTLNFSIGYLAFDILIMLMHRSEFEWFFALHHFVSIVAFYACSTAGVFPYIALCRLISEGSTPFLNNRWFLLTLNKKKSKLYMYNGICLILVFTLVRILQIVPNWRIFFELMNTAEWASIEFRYKLICVGSCVPLDVLNVYWFTKIINIVIKTLMGGKSSEKELKEKSSAKELKAE